MKGKMTEQFEQPISLALSGGGTRAMAYHLGVLKFLAERGLFERVTRISTVSGGSLVTGLIYRSAGFRWPSSEHFLKTTLPELTKLLCDRSLQAEALSQIFWPPNLRYLLSRANLVALELQEHWGFNIPLKCIPSGPEWSINGTNAQNGKRFRFKGTQIGDYNVGYAEAPDFPLACALAVSAAFPVGIGPLRIKTDDFVWKIRPNYGAPEMSAQVVELDYEYLHLYDGGLYDNLGSEALFDIGKLQSKHPGDYIIVSDAGAPLTYGMSWGPLSPERLKRMMDVMSDQTRALRVRSFVNFLQQNPRNGAFIPIGTNITDPKCAEAEFARTFPTTLDRFDRRDFERLVSHGYDVALKTNRDYGVYGQATATTDSGAPSDTTSAATAATSVKPKPATVKPSFAPASSPYAIVGKRKAAEEEQPKPLVLFEAVDVAVARLLGKAPPKPREPAKLRRMPEWWEKWGEELLSPPIAGLGIGGLLLMIDNFVSTAASSSSRFDHWFTEAIKKVAPFLFAVSFVLFGIALVLAAIPLLRRSRLALLRAIAKVGQDAATFAFGAVFVLGAHQAIGHGLSAAEWAISAYVSYLLAVLAAVSWGVREITHEFTTRAVRSVSGLVVSLAVGGLFVYFGVPALITSTKAQQDERQAFKAPLTQKGAPAGSVSSSSASAAVY